MKTNLPSLEELKTTRLALRNGEISIEDIQDEIEVRRKEKLFQISKSIPNPMAEIPEGNKLIILIDIVGFSKSSTREQVYNIYLFQRYLASHVLLNRLGSFSKKIHIRNFIPTGDGCYIVADECDPDSAIGFLIALIGGFKELENEDGQHLSLRASALIGSCVPFLDIAKHLNFVGEGMNEASRILSGGQKELEQCFKSENPEAAEIDSKMYSRNSLYLGDSLTKTIQNYEEYCNKIVIFKNVSDKHGRKRNVTVLQGIKL